MERKVLQRPRRPRRREREEGRQTQTRRDAQHGHRRRPYRVEYTGSLSTSEVKRRRARLVLGWGTAWELLRVLSAFAFVCPVSFVRTRCAQALLAKVPCISKRPLCELQFRRRRKKESKDPVGQSSLVGPSSLVQSVSWSGSVQSVGRVWSVSPVSAVQSISWSSPVGQCPRRLWCLEV